MICLYSRFKAVPMFDLSEPKNIFVESIQIITGQL
jgi:hypothetical protein